MHVPIIENHVGTSFGCFFLAGRVWVWYRFRFMPCCIMLHHSKEKLSECATWIRGRQGIRPLRRKSWDPFWRFCLKCDWCMLTSSPLQLKPLRLDAVNFGLQRSCDALEHCHVVEWRTKLFAKLLAMTLWGDGPRANQRAILGFVVKTWLKHAGASRYSNSIIMTSYSLCFRFWENLRRSLRMPFASSTNCIYHWSQSLSSLSSLQFINSKDV